jgi:hypothetical protein
MTIEPAIPPTEPRASDVHVQGEVVLHRLYDVGYGIDLDAVLRLLGDRAPARSRPVRGEAQAILIPNPPVAVGLGAAPVVVAGVRREVELSARIFDFGVVSISARLALPGSMPWSDYRAWCSACVNAPGWRELFTETRDALRVSLAEAIDRAGESPVSEDYVVFRIDRLSDGAGRPLRTDALRDEELAQLLLDETRPLSATARRDLLSPRFTYFEDDLAMLTWNAALVVEPVAADRDVQYVLEFANAQLLELRYYDAQLDRELAHMYDQVAAARLGFRRLGRRYGRLLSSLQTRLAEATELVERTENALKMTDDVFLARIYAAALEIFRGPTWRAGIDGKMGIMRETYAMLNDESQSGRAEFLELIIVLLILLELVLAPWHR